MGLHECDTSGGAAGTGVGATTPFSVLLLERHAIVREGLRSLLARNPRVQVVAESGDTPEAIHLVEAFRPGLVITDLSLPALDGIKAIRRFRECHPPVKVIALTVHHAEEYVRAAIQAGAGGYLLKEDSYAELEHAIGSVLGGGTYLSRSIARHLPAGSLHRAAPAAKASWERLTQRERMVLQLIAGGLQNKRIADYLCISMKTVEKHRANLMRKLNLHNAAAITAFAMERQLVSGEPCELRRSQRTPARVRAAAGG